MKIELKKITYNARQSQETNAYAADLWVGGVRIGEVSNAGHGGCDTFHGDHIAYDRANEWCKRNLPNWVCEGCDLGPTDLETHCGNILAEWIDSKALKAAMRSKVLTLDAGRIMAAGFKGVRKITDRHIDLVKFNAPAGTVVLNALPFPEALALYQKHA